MQAPVRVAQSDTAYIIAEISARGLQDVVRDRHGLGHSGQLQVWWTGDGGRGEAGGDGGATAVYTGTGRVGGAGGR